MRSGASSGRTAFTKRTKARLTMCWHRNETSVSLQCYYRILNTGLTQHVDWTSKQITYGLYLSDHSILNDIETEITVLSGIMIQNLPRETGWHLRGTRRIGVSMEDTETIQRCVSWLASTAKALHTHMQTDRTRSKVLRTTLTQSAQSCRHRARGLDIRILEEAWVSAEDANTSWRSTETRSPGVMAYPTAIHSRLETSIPRRPYQTHPTS